MAQLENGYTRIANEILEALCRFRIPGEARMILDAIIRETYGWARKEASIRNDDFVRLTGLCRQNISRAITKLLDRNLIFKNGHVFQFNKDHETWCESKRIQTKRIQSDSKKNPIRFVSVSKVIQHTLYKKKKEIKESPRVVLMKDKNDRALVWISSDEHDKLIERFGVDDAWLMVRYFREQYLALASWNKNKYKSPYRAMLNYHNRKYFPWLKNLRLRDEMLMKRVKRREAVHDMEKRQEVQDIERISLDEIREMAKEQGL